MLVEVLDWFECGFAVLRNGQRIRHVVFRVSDSHWLVVTFLSAFSSLELFGAVDAC